MLQTIQRFKWMIVVLLVALVAVLLHLWNGRTQAAATPGNTLTLVAPPFVQVASAQEGTEESAEAAETAAALAAITEEAGISAWYRATSSIDLNAARAAFRTVEAQTSSYIVGSIPIAGLPELYDVHAYAHVDGWMIAYYLRADPASKIIHIGTMDINNTLLDRALSLLATSAGVASSQATYYDFRYPNATHILIVAEDDDNGDDFVITLPADLVYFERSWTLLADRGRLRLNGSEIAGLCGGWAYGTFTAAQMPVATPHVLRAAVENLCNDTGAREVNMALLITYRDQ